MPGRQTRQPALAVVRYLATLCILLGAVTLLLFLILQSGQTATGCSLPSASCADFCASPSNPAREAACLPHCRTVLGRW